MFNNGVLESVPVLAKNTVRKNRAYEYDTSRTTPLNMKTTGYDSYLVTLLAASP
jgi:hypothetical protein